MTDGYMTDEEYAELVAKFYQCKLSLAKIIIKSAELNHKTEELQETIRNEMIKNG